MSIFASKYLLIFQFTFQVFLLKARYQLHAWRLEMLLGLAILYHYVDVSTSFEYVLIEDETVEQVLYPPRSKITPLILQCVLNYSK